MAPIYGVIINWFSQIYGYINFKIENTSKNYLPFDFLMIEEAYHNSHPKRSGSANLGMCTLALH
jgi:stearoyl-CoA desaturase (delta-9 desaturase)